MKFWLRKYFIVIFAVATLLGVLHHHDDFKQHSNCQLCLLKSNLSHADASAGAHTLPNLDFVKERIVCILPDPLIFSSKNTIQVRAPPYSTYIL